MNGKLSSTLIPVISIILITAVAVLYFMPKPDVSVGFDVHVLPAINAVINAMCFVVLCIGLYFIKQGNIPAHKMSMIIALSLSVLFLLLYVTYHAIAQHTEFGGEGPIRIVYLTLLGTHIVLAAAIVPLVLITLSRALSSKFDKHRKIARVTLPLWLYVSLSGVIIYFMIAPYY